MQLRQPPVYEAYMSNAAMLAEQRPFAIGRAMLYPHPPPPLHWHDAYEIGMVLAGTGTLVIDDLTLPYVPNQVHVINGSEPHMAYPETPTEFFNVHFHPALLLSNPFSIMSSATQSIFATEVYQFSPLLPADAPHTAEIVALLRAIAAEHEQQAEGWQFIIYGHVLHIVGILLRHAIQPGERSAERQRQRANLQRLAPAIAALAADRYPPHTLAELADLVGLSPAHFSTLFHQTLGSPPIAYRNLLRVQQARQLLTETTLPIERIGALCGFTASQQFHRVFLRATGLTPNGYRHQFPTTPGSEERKIGSSSQ